MELETARAGMRVRVRSDYGESYQGSVGTIQKRYGTLDYTAFEVLLPDGHTKLFWDHQLEEVREPAYRPKRRWTFW